MDTIEQVITQEQHDAFERELAELAGERREQIKQQLVEARGFGDLSENAEYDAAREAQGQNEARIKELEQILATSRVVETVDTDAVTIGCRVEVVDEQGNHRSFHLVGATKTNSLRGDISNESPVGMALTGHAEGDEVSFSTPSGKVRTYRILSIEVPKAEKA